MNPFLKQVAQYIIDAPDIDLGNTTIIVPNRRSGVFFTAYLNECITRPTISPEVLSISELTSSLSENQENERMAQLFLLHQVYQEITQHQEPLDEFYFWGEILLNDFNDIDNYMIEANDLFGNIKDLKEIENHFDYLTENQLQAIKSFWGVDLTPNSSNTRTQFLSIWSKLSDIYNEFRRRLQKNNSCYSGMFYRNLVETWDTIAPEKLSSAHYVFVGFNALNKAETNLFKLFAKHKSCLFFWDYDEEFLSDEMHEAGLFIRKNLIQFPPPNDFTLEGGCQAEQSISIVSVPSQIAQTQLINHPEFKPFENGEQRFDDNAIVLAEENLLAPTVSAAGNLGKEINITMGYPISNTPVYSFVNLLIELHRNFRQYNQKPAYYFRPVVSILNHQMTSCPAYKELVNKIHSENKIYVHTELFQHDELLRLLFQRHDKWEDFSTYLLNIISALARKYQDKSEDKSNASSLEAEYLYQAYLGVQQLHDALQTHAPNAVSLRLYFRILQQMTNRISIPFEGEPLSGMQVMGVLETRNLDFQKVYMFSVNHGRLPSAENSHSFIPYNLRKAFELPTYEEHDAMYAYYFYRMLNRAKEVVLVYDSSSNGLTTGEMSRYLYQLIYDSNRNIKQLELDFDFKSSENKPIAIPSTPQHRSRLLQRYQERKLSPSELNTYLECKLKFYLSYVANIKESEELDEDVDNRMFGNLFHEASEIIYAEFGDNTITADLLEKTAKNELKLNKAIHQAFAKVYFKDKKLKQVEITGTNKLVASSLLGYLRQMLRNDKAFAPFQMLGLEQQYLGDFQVEVDGKKENIKIGGTVDRIDLADGKTRIIDYKTGQKAKLDFSDMEELTDRQKNERPKEIFQTLLYCEVYLREHPNSKISPNIYKINTFFRDFNPEILWDKKPINWEECRIAFNELLDKLLLDLFQPNNVFDQKEKDDCAFCPYVRICGRTESAS